MSQDMLAALGTWGPIVLMIAIFYFLLYRPQKIEHKKRAKMLESLKRGDHHHRRHLRQDYGGAGEEVAPENRQQRGN